ncbi:MAG TPA: hypothetical protein PK728_12855 [Bacillota bacterium]|nr:hypothetical protein [Bacillota bacterium]
MSLSALLAMVSTTSLFSKGGWFSNNKSSFFIFDTFYDAKYEFIILAINGGALKTGMVEWGRAGDAAGDAFAG